MNIKTHKNNQKCYFYRFPYFSGDFGLFGIFFSYHMTFPLKGVFPNKRGFALAMYKVCVLLS